MNPLQHQPSPTNACSPHTQRGTPTRPNAQSFQCPSKAINGQRSTINKDKETRTRTRTHPRGPPGRSGPPSAPRRGAPPCPRTPWLHVQKGKGCFLWVGVEVGERGGRWSSSRSRRGPRSERHTNTMMQRGEGFGRVVLVVPTTRPQTTSIVPRSVRSIDRSTMVGWRVVAAARADQRQSRGRFCDWVLCWGAAPPLLAPAGVIARRQQRPNAPNACVLRTPCAPCPPNPPLRLVSSALFD